MHRQNLLSLLEDYESVWGASEGDSISRLRAFVESTPRCFERDNPGHVTGSALVVDSTGESVLLTLHRKLGRWLQLGGHADGDSDIQRVAEREAEEESGIPSLRFVAAPETAIFDIDIHLIPERKTEPAHFHYDVRFLFVASDPSQLRCSEESNDLRWHPLPVAYTLSEDASLLRQFRKLENVRGRLLL